MLEKVISGGQTGADRCGLFAAHKVGIPTGGTAPKGYKTERGVEPELLNKLGLKESDSASYTPRTHQNILDSEATVLFGNMESVGSSLTIRLCDEEEQPYIENPTKDQLVNFIKDNKVRILNVAGNRGSKMTKQYKLELLDLLTSAFKECI